MPTLTWRFFNISHKSCDWYQLDSDFVWHIVGGCMRRVTYHQSQCLIRNVRVSRYVTMFPVNMTTIYERSSLWTSLNLNLYPADS